MLDFSDPATIGGTVLVAGLVIFVIRTIMVEEKPVAGLHDAACYIARLHGAPELVNCT